MFKITRKKEHIKPLLIDVNGNIIVSKRYLISSYGRIFDKNTNTYLKTYQNHRGYDRVHLDEPELYPKAYRGLHRLVALAFVKNPNNYSQVINIDGDKTNNFADNIKWISNSDLTYSSLVKNNKNGFTVDEIHKIGSLMTRPWNYNTILKSLGYDKDRDYKKFEILMSIDKNIKYRTILNRYKRVPKNSEPLKFRKTISNVDIIHKACKLMEEHKWSYEGICIKLEIDNSYKRTFKKILSSVYNKKKYKSISIKYDIKEPYKENNRYSTEIINLMKLKLSTGSKNIDIIKEFGCSESFVLRLKKTI